MNFPLKFHQEETGILHDAAAPQVSQRYITYILHVATNVLKIQLNMKRKRNKITFAKNNLKARASIDLILQDTLVLHTTEGSFLT